MPTGVVDCGSPSPDVLRAVDHENHSCGCGGHDCATAPRFLPNGFVPDRPLRQESVSGPRPFHELGPTREDSRQWGVPVADENALAVG